jgi:hypothetical protein
MGVPQHCSNGMRGRLMKGGGIRGGRVRRELELGKAKRKFRGIRNEVRENGKVLKIEHVAVIITIITITIIALLQFPYVFLNW